MVLETNGKILQEGTLALTLKLFVELLIFFLAKKTSHLVQPADGHNTTGQVTPSAHGNGPLEISVPGFPLALDDIVVNSSKELGGRFPYNQDLNAGETLGFSTLPLLFPYQQSLNPQ